MFLLDTHLVLWAAYVPERLSTKATKLLRSREVPLAFSLATLWEVTIKTSLSRPGFSVDPHQLHQALLAEGFVELAIQAPHIGWQRCLGFIGIHSTGCWWPRPWKSG
jgi:PIN domain nuclease of toxin-antitoxin system